MRVTLVSNLNLSGLNSGAHEPKLDAVTPPLGLLTLAAFLDQSGHDVSFADFNYAIAKGEISLDRQFYSAAVERIASQQPDLVGFSTMCNSFHITLRLAELVKAALPNTPILLGGPQVSFVDLETMNAFPFIDLVLRGEADLSLPILIETLTDGRSVEQVEGLTFRAGDRIVQNPAAPIVKDMDSLPDPAWDLFPYETGDAPAIDVGRGCPFACTFCSTSVFFQRRFRLKSYDRIIREMWMLKNKYGAKGITLVHDLFVADRKWIGEFCRRLRQEEGLDVTWSASARIDTVDEGLLAAMGAAGCRGLFYGVESGSPRIQKLMGKRLKVERVAPVADWSLAAKVTPTMSFIAGFPFEIEDDVSQTLDLVQDLQQRPLVNVQLHLMSPQLGTNDMKVYKDRLHLDGYFSDIACNNAIFVEPEWFRQYPGLFPSFYYFETDGVSRELLKGLDQFVRLPCSVMQQTVRELLSTGESLWKLYVAWRQWCDEQGLSGEVWPGSDEIIIAFSKFAVTAEERGFGTVAPDRVRDEVLGFYLCHYHGLTVGRLAEPQAEDTAAATVA